MQFLNVYHDFISWLERHLLTCPSKHFFLLDCPGCGLQRSFVALMKGEMLESVKIYPALLPILLLFIYTALHLVFRFKQGAKNLTIWFMICAGIILVHYIYKVITHQTI